MQAPGTKIVDANVWLALAFGDHVHHQSASNWLNSQSDGICAFWRVTQFSLLRHLTNAKIMGKFVQSQQQAWDTYDRFKRDPRVVFCDEPFGVEVEFRNMTQSNHPSHSRWADAYLAAFAKLSMASITTFDRGFKSFPGVQVELLTQP
jgi:uncharacterized protein